MNWEWQKRTYHWFGTDLGHFILKQIESSPPSRPDLAVDFAEYNTNWQLSLDCNLPGDAREHHAQLAKTAALRIAAKISA